MNNKRNDTIYNSVDVNLFHTINMLCSFNKKYFHILWLIFEMIESISAKQIACDFNKLCVCHDYQQLTEVTCIGVSLSRMPDMSGRKLYRIRIVGARDISVIEKSDFANVTFSSLTLSRSKLSFIEPLAFSQLRQTLTTLELSHSNIREFPSIALSHLPQLQWLSLRGNKIEELKSKDLKDIITLRSLLLSDNLLSVVHDHTFREVSSLEYLDLDGNMISSVEGTPFPSSLTTLSLANCLLKEVPIDALSNLKNLQFLQLRGNLIHYLRQMKIATQTLEMLDLSHNLISSFSSNVFISNESANPHNPLSESTNSLKYTTDSYVNISYSRLRIRDLHLDFNFIQSLPNGIFRHISVERLSLSNNRITSAFIASDAFDGPMISQLKALDLNYNFIDVFPDALKKLYGLRQLMLKNNRLKYIDDNAFINSNKLEVLDLSRNLLRYIPSHALRAVTNLLRLSLQENLISKLDDNDLGEWSVSLLSLTLSKNELRYISRKAFKHAKNLRELRLSGNNILHANSDTFVELRSLELLDISYALNYANAEQLIHSVSNGLDSLKWLQLDNNSLKYVPSLALQAMPALIHVDLENNQIKSVQSDFHAKSNLNTIILSRNQLNILESLAFSDLPHLEHIALYFNQIHTIGKHAFRNLPKLKTVILSKNQISNIERHAFYNLSDESPSLNILLDENQLKCFSMEIFDQMVSVADSERRVLYINVSHNEIERIANCGEAESSNVMSDMADTAADHDQPKQTLSLRALDLSFNSIPSIPNEFSESIAHGLHSLHMNNNRLTRLPIAIIKYCASLQILTLDHNLISKPSEQLSDNETWISDLQMLSLRYNQVLSLSEFVILFKYLKNLKMLDLSHNLIGILPKNVFVGTNIEKLFLSNNLIRNIDLKVSDASKEDCLGVKHSLKYLDLSHNYLSWLPIEVMSCENLIELTLTNNLIEQLSEHSFASFKSMLRLDLSNNRVKKVDNNCFVKCLPNLNSLKLNNISISAVPALNLPHLTHIELSANLISVVSQQSFARSRRIRHLDLARNMIQDVPRYIWKYMTKLQLLNLAYNPIDVLDTSSFADLQMLRYLDIRGLNLQYIDSRLLHNHRYLISLKTSTYPNVRAFRLHDVLAKTASLRTALIEVQETTLSHQIQWAFGTKIKELIITGTELIKILPDAFLGLHRTYDLTLRVTNTNITKLPNGLLKYLADIRFMTIDLRNNKLQSLKPDVFLARPDNHLSNQWESQQLLGGILLDDNPLKCDCGLLWISDWMKRWISDMRTVSIDAAFQANIMASKSQCFIDAVPVYSHNSNDSQSHIISKRISLIDLTSDQISCENIAIMLNANSIIFVLINLYRLCFLEYLQININYDLKLF